MSNDVNSRGGWDLLLLSGEHTSLNGANNRSAFVQLPSIRAPAHQNMFGVATPGQKGWQGGKVLQRGGNWLHRGGKGVAIGCTGVAKGWQLVLQKLIRLVTVAGLQ